MDSHVEIAVDDVGGTARCTQEGETVLLESVVWRGAELRFTDAEKELALMFKSKGHVTFITTFNTGQWDKWSSMIHDGQRTGPY